ncbi:MAG: hypothetical protein VYC49_13170 [Pseudomonadota bacterium]|nr:hypothetical protein [Pseudomonadota bacterium]
MQGARCPLGHSEFRICVDNELSGYKNIEDLPDYRILHVISKGHFAGPFNSGMNNADIPLSCLPEEFREIMSRSNIWSRLLPLKLSLLNLTAVPANNLGIRILLPWLARKFIKT